MPAGGTALAIRTDATPMLFQAMSPAERIVQARAIATELRSILDIGKRAIDAGGNFYMKPLVIRVPQTKWNKTTQAKEIIGYSEHVELEGWQTCGFLSGVTAIVRWCREVPDSDPITYESRAEIVRVDTGLIIGGGEGTCSRAETRWANADLFAIKSMSQTRAQSRAYRGLLAWIMVLAGYSPTPAEEVPPEGFDHGQAPSSGPKVVKATVSRADEARAKTREKTEHGKGRPVELLNRFMALHMGRNSDEFVDFIQREIPGAHERIKRSSDLMDEKNKDLYDATARFLGDVEDREKAAQ